MSVNLTPHDAKPKIVTLYKEPCIIVSQTALQKMNYIIDLNDKEVGWLGSVVMQDNCLVILDVYLFKQEVAHATCEITPEGLAEFGMEILALPEGMALYNSIKLWGHSHVNMGTFASGQDDTQMGLFKTSGHDWFLRVIANKKGEMKFTFYDYANSIIVEDVKWGIVAPQIAGLKEQMEAEIKEKVSDLVTSYTTNNNWGTSWQNRNTDYLNSREGDWNDYGYWEGGVFIRWSDNITDEAVLEKLNTFTKTSYLGGGKKKELEKRISKRPTENHSTENHSTENRSTETTKKEIESTETGKTGLLGTDKYKKTLDRCRIGMYWEGNVAVPYYSITDRQDIVVFFSDDELYDIASNISEVGVRFAIEDTLAAFVGTEVIVTDDTVKKIWDYAVEVLNNYLEQLALASGGL